MLDDKHGFDHVVFVPLMLMFPDAKVPVVCVSLDTSLSVEKNMNFGTALQPLRHEAILILGSGYTLHYLRVIFDPSKAHLKPACVQASIEFNNWLNASHGSNSDGKDARLLEWSRAPGARLCHPKEEHLLPLFMTTAAAGWDSKAEVIYDDIDRDCSISGYLFH